MGKLEEFTRTAGMNGGASLYAKVMRVQDIQTAPELSSLFPIAEETLASIIESMKESGYDNAEPVVLWRGRNILVDGHTRLKAAIEAGITEIPVEEKDFERIEDAVLYAYSRQANRRNLTQGEIYHAAVTLKEKAERDGNGRAAEKLAKLLGISESTIYRARAIEEKAGDEVKDAVKHGDMSINKAYQRIKKKKELEGESDRAYSSFDTDSTDSFETAPQEEGERIPSTFVEEILPDSEDPFAETRSNAERGEQELITLIDEAIENLEKYLETLEGDTQKELWEVRNLLQKIRTEYITG